MTKLKHYILLIIVFVHSNILFSQNFITTWKTNNPSSSSNTTITIPTHLDEVYNYDVDWDNDGVFDELGVTSNITHDFGIIGTYTIAIRGVFPRIYFNNEGDNFKILSVDQWGDIQWESMENAFFGCFNLVLNATDVPNLSLVTNMDNMLNGPTTLMFHEPLNSWDTSHVTSMRNTFANASDFNQDISNWDVSNVTDMSGMFDNACHFQQNIGNWDTSNVTNMNAMFRFACLFNGDISGWDVGNVEDMSSMFNSAQVLNQNLNNWNTSSVEFMNNMFQDAVSFNQNLGDWDVTNVIDMTNMFLNVTLSTENYDNTLIGWNSQSVQNGVSFHGGNSTYCNGEIARNNMIISNNWIIVDGNLDCSSLSVNDNVINRFKMYPNPANDVLFLEGLNGKSKIEIVNIIGKIILQIDNGITKNKMDISMLKSAIYFIRVTTENKTSVKKFIKN